MSPTQSDIAQKIFIGAVVCVMSCLGTLALAGSSSISRVDAQNMVYSTEVRLNVQIMELKSQQNMMAAKIDQILAEQIKTSTKLELYTGSK